MSRCNTSIAIALAASALAAPAASADMHASTATAAARERVQQAPPTQDLRSPDTRDAANGRATSNVPDIAVIRVPVPAPGEGGIDLRDAGLGAGGLLVALALAAGGTATVLRRRQTAAT